MTKKSQKRLKKEKILEKVPEEAPDKDLAIFSVLPRSSHAFFVVAALCLPLGFFSEKFLFVAILSLCMTFLMAGKYEFSKTSQELSFKRLIWPFKSRVARFSDLAFITLKPAATNLAPNLRVVVVVTSTGKEIVVTEPNGPEKILKDLQKIKQCSSLPLLDEQMLLPTSYLSRTWLDVANPFCEVDPLNARRLKETIWRIQASTAGFKPMGYGLCSLPDDLTKKSIFDLVVGILLGLPLISLTTLLVYQNSLGIFSIPIAALVLGTAVSFYTTHRPLLRYRLIFNLHDETFFFSALPLPLLSFFNARGSLHDFQGLASYRSFTLGKYRKVKTYRWVLILSNNVGIPFLWTLDNAADREKVKLLQKRLKIRETRPDDAVFRHSWAFRWKVGVLTGLITMAIYSMGLYFFL